MARLSAISLGFLLIQATFAQAYGRFGYSELPAVPGFRIEKDGFTAQWPSSDKFRFAQAPTAWKVTFTTDAQQDITMKSSDGPSELRVNLYSPGFMLRFPRDFSLHLSSTASPYLTWKEGTVGEHVPTPDVRWVAVSFRDNQPPIVLGFLDSDVSLQVDGQTGNWSIRTSKPYAGWVRVALPFGTRPFPAVSAAGLGKLSEAVSSSDEVWWQHSPKLIKADLKDEDTAVEVAWQFDRPGAVVPVGAALANLGSYPLTIRSKTHRLQGYLEEGPVTICDEATLTIRFPIQRIPLGRPLVVGTPQTSQLGTASAFDVSSVAELALENLLASRDARSRATGEETVGQFIEETAYSLEPNTNQRLPFDAQGNGSDLTAANAFLYQASALSTRSDSDDNALLNSIELRRDWYTWRIWTFDSKISRRAGALASLAGALCPEPYRRLEAAMIQAGLAAERGLGTYLSRAERKPEPMLLEPLVEMRNSIFHMIQRPRQNGGFADTLFGTLRIFGDASASLEADGTLSWNAADAPALMLVSGYPLTVEGKDVTTVQALGYTRIVSTSKTVQTVKLILPDWAPKLPALVAPPRYSETAR